MRLEWLEYSITTAHVGSISAAAERHKVTRPAVSTALKKLEQEVGRELFRTGRAGVTLTAEGMQVLERAQQVMAIIDDMRVGTAEETVCFVVDSQSSLVQYLNETIVTPFKALHPNIHVTLRPVYIGDAVDEFRHGSKISVVLDGKEARVLERVRQFGCETVRLGMVTRKMFLGAGHRLAGKAVLDAEDLQGEYIAYYSGGQNHISGRYAPYFAGEYRLADMEDVLSLAVRNEAVVILPELTVRCARLVRKGALVEKDIPFPGIEKTAPIHAVRVPHLSSAEELFWEYLIANFPKKP